jgi:hypothetical protein
MLPYVINPLDFILFFAYGPRDHRRGWWGWLTIWYEVGFVGTYYCDIEYWMDSH